LISAPAGRPWADAGVLTRWSGKSYRGAGHGPCLGAVAAVRAPRPGRPPHRRTEACPGTSPRRRPPAAPGPSGHRPRGITALHPGAGGRPGGGRGTPHRRSGRGRRV